MTAASVDELLAADMGRFYADPLGWVMYAYDWGNDPSLQLVKLQSPWDLLYDSEYGPDAWACEFLDEIGRQVKGRNFDGSHAVKPQRHAVVSGHGIGKSAISAWIVGWLMATRPMCKGTVTAGTATQLSTKTWAEVAKWNRKSIVGHWFEVGTGRGSMKMYHREYPESWFASAQTCRPEDSEAFAGQHAADSTSFYLFDEASQIDHKIWDVSEGGLTTGEPMMFVFGNPTRNTGAFFECFNADRARWTTRQIDSRTVQVTNKIEHAEWIAKHGEDSDFVRVRVRGVFPRASSMQFIARDLVDSAMARIPETTAMGKRTAAVGVDVARFGDDKSVIRTRIGRDGSTWASKEYRGIATMQLAAQVANHIRQLRATGLRVVTFVDGGGVGGGVVDRLRELGYDVIEVQFGAKAADSRMYANKRAEMWGRMKEWLATGCLDKHDALATDLTAVEYSFRTDDTILLEPKEVMKRRGLASPDDADALACTFAEPVPEFTVDDVDRDEVETPGNHGEYDPFARERMR